MVEMLVPRPADVRLRQRAGGYVRNEIVDAKREFWTAEQYHSKHAGGTISRSELQTFAENPNGPTVRLGQRIAGQTLLRRLTRELRQASGIERTPEQVQIWVINNSTLPNVFMRDVLKDPDIVQELAKKMKIKHLEESPPSSEWK